MMPGRWGRAAGRCALAGALAAAGEQGPALAAAGEQGPARGAGQPPGGERLLYAGQLLDRVLAVVGGQLILLSDVRLFLETGLVEPTEAVDPALDRLIERRLILDQAARYVVEDPAPGDVDARLTRIERHVGGSPALDETLAATGHTRADLEQVVRDDLRIEGYMARRFPPPSRPSEASARQALIDDWLDSLPARAAVIRVAP